jgi:hypothetical protein
MEIKKEIVERLETAILKSNQELIEIEDLVKDIDDYRIITSLLKVFENNENFDFGNPGNLVRFIEKFYKNENYETELYKSVQRKPTEYNLWMLNRLLNSFDNEQKEKGILLLENIINSDKSENIKDIAKEFWEEQTEG